MFNFKEIRKNKGYTQSNVANMLGVAKNTISQWENENRQPDLQMIIKLADLYNCSVDYLIGHKKVEANSNALVVPEEKKEVVNQLLSLSEQHFKFIATEIQTCLKLNQAI